MHPRPFATMADQRHRRPELPLCPCEGAKEERKTEQQRPDQIKPGAGAVEGKTQAHRAGKDHPENKKGENNGLLHGKTHDTGVNRGMQENTSLSPRHPEN